MAFTSRVVCKIQYFKRLLIVQRCLCGINSEFIDKSRFQKKIAVISNGNSDRKWEKGSIRPRHIVSMSILAVVLAAKPDDDKQESKENDDDSHKAEVITLIKRAKLAEMRQKFEDAEDYYHQALELLTAQKKTSAWTVEDLTQARVYVYDHMANLALFTGQFMKAEGLYKETMRGLLQQGYEQTHNAIVELSLKLAMIYAMLDRLSEAEHGYNYCISTQQAKIQALEKQNEEVPIDTTALFGLILDSYSKFLMAQSKYTEALDNVEKSLSMAEKVFGILHSQVGVLYNDKATVLSMMGEHEQAKNNVMKAIYIAKKVESTDLPTFICNLGAVCIHTNELKEADLHCSRAVKIAQKLSNQEALEQANKCLAEIKIKLKDKKG